MNCFLKEVKENKCVMKEGKYRHEMKVVLGNPSVRASVMVYTRSESSELSMKQSKSLVKAWYM